MHIPRVFFFLFFFKLLKITADSIRQNKGRVSIAPYSQRMNLRSHCPMHRMVKRAPNVIYSVTRTTRLNELIITVFDMAVLYFCMSFSNVNSRPLKQIQDHFCKKVDWCLGRTRIKEAAFCWLYKTTVIK